MTQPTYLTVTEVATMLRVPRTRAYALVAAGDLPAVRLGERSIRINKAELETFLLEQRRAGPAKAEKPKPELEPEDDADSDDIPF